MGEPPHPDVSTPPYLRPLASLLMALRFYSRLPTGGGYHEAPDINRIARVLPLASLIIDLFPALVLLFAILGGLPPLFSILLALGCSALVTGAMSEDAAADAADGLFGGATPERRLEIMRDSRHGTYGVLTLILLVGMKATALWPVVARDPYAAVFLWLSAGILARSISLWLPVALLSARTDGAAATAGKLSRNAFVIGVVFAMAAAYILSAAFTGPEGLGIAIVVAAMVAVGWRQLCKKLVGGTTGDLIGALQSLLEVVVLVVFMRAFLG